MPITEFLEENAVKYPGETALVELNPEVQEIRRTTWKEYELIERPLGRAYRREITWRVFDEKANRCANLLIGRGIKKGDKVAILMMNGIEWLPIYFGALKAGALAVPLNFRYTAEEIRYCLDLSDADFAADTGSFDLRIKTEITVHRGGSCTYTAFGKSSDVSFNDSSVRTCRNGISVIERLSLSKSLGSRRNLDKTFRGGFLCGGFCGGCGSLFLFLGFLS